MRGVINFSWYFFKWGVVLAIVAALASAPFLFRRVDETIRRKIESKIGENYPHLSVRIRSAQLIDGQGIEVRGVSIVEPAAAGPQAELVYIDEMLLGCDTSLQELATGEPKITQVKIRRPTLRTTRRPDGSWSSTRLLPLPRLGGKLVSGVIENGTIEMFDPLKNPSSTFTLRDIQISFKPSDSPGLVGAAASPGAPPPDKQRWIDLQGAFAADQMQRVQITGKFDLDSQRWCTQGTIEGLQVGPELYAVLPGISPQMTEKLAALRGEARCRFLARREQDMPAPLHYEVDAELTRGRIDDPRLPYPLTDVRAHAVATPAGLKVDDLTAHNGETSIKLSLERRGWADGSPLTLAAEGLHLRLDRQLVKILPEAAAVEWYKFLPEGEIHAKVKLAYEAGVWTPQIEARILNVAFTYHKFPYRLERAAGMLSLENNHLKMNVTAFSGAQAVTIRGDLTNPGHSYTGGVEINGENLSFDDKLLAALPEQSRAVVRSLRPQGQFNLTGRLWRDDPAALKPHEDFQLRLNRCSICYEKFPYPIGNIHGTIELHDGAWQFRNLEGRNDTAQVRCQGSLTPVGDKHQLAITIAADNVPLEEELRDALSPEVQHLWLSLKPRGSCDLHADVTYSSGAKRLGLRVDARPRPETTSIEPVAFPYRLEKLRGAIRYQDGHVDFDSLEAAHGRTLVSSGGYCDFSPDGRWKLQFKKLSVDRVKFDHELVAALPEGLRKAVLELKPNAPINLRGAFGFARGNTANAPLTSEWDLTVDLSQMTVDPGIKLENIYGAVHFAGAFDGERFYSRGELALDSVTYKNYQFTQVLGPLWIDNTRLLLGAWAESKQSRSPRSVTARIFGGTALADCQVMFVPTPQFHLRASLSEGDLGQFAQEHLVGEQSLKGKVLANLQLQGNNKGTRSLLGDGAIRLHDADVYELPAMVQLLKILSVRSPDKTAFTQSDIDFRIQGDYVIFDRINFKGDAISLLGRGQMNLDTQVNLTFRAEIGRGDWTLPVVRTMLSEASSQVMQLRVDGTLDHPNIRREAFPGVNQALQQLQADLQNPDAPPPAAPQARRMWPPLFNRR